jgi:hypothetical protein
MNFSKKLKSIFLTGALSFAVVVPGFAVEPEGFFIKSMHKHKPVDSKIEDNRYVTFRNLAAIKGFLQVTEDFKVAATFVFGKNEASREAFKEFRKFIIKNKKIEKEKRVEGRKYQKLEYSEFSKYLKYLRYVDPKKPYDKLKPGTYCRVDGIEVSDSSFDVVIDTGRRHPWTRYAEYFEKEKDIKEKRAGYTKRCSEIRSKISEINRYIGKLRDEIQELQNEVKGRAGLVDHLKGSGFEDSPLLIRTNEDNEGIEDRKKLIQTCEQEKEKLVTEMMLLLKKIEDLGNI